MKTNNSEVSVGYWMMAIFVACFPLVNLVAVPILAFFGGNASKKNFYRALLAWFVIVLLIHVALLAAGVLPVLYGAIKGMNPSL